MNKCIGCGAILTLDKDKEGYTSCIDNNLCERCFRIKNYNDYKVILKDNNDYINILKEIDKSDDLVILVVDMLNINNKLSEISKYIHNKILLVLTKYDLMPSNNEEKYIKFFKKYNLNIIDTVIISSEKNYNMDVLYSKIKNYHKVYVVGYTNAGKSSMINKLIYHYSNEIREITTSNLPSTTLNTIEINIDDLTIIDTPGLLDDSIINYVDPSLIKKITPKKKIKPITYQVKSKQSIVVEDILRIDCNNTNITCYFSNNLSIKRIYKDNNILIDNKKYTFSVESGKDIVILGLGFIHVSKNTIIDIYVVGNTSVFVRDALIGG